MEALDAGGTPKPGGTSSLGRVRDDQVREYIGDMARELALMARWAGDETLYETLIAAAAWTEQDRP